MATLNGQPAIDAAVEFITPLSWGTTPRKWGASRLAGERDVAASGGAAAPNVGMHGCSKLKSGRLYGSDLWIPGHSAGLSNLLNSSHSRFV